MHPLVSVIVPTYNSQKHIQTCLASIADQEYPYIEIVVVDKDSTDNTKGIARQFTQHIFNHGPERGAQRNYGVAKSTGSHVLIIDSDMRLGKYVVKELVSLTKMHDDITAAVIPERSIGDGFWAQCKILERSYYVGIPWMEAARFFPRSIFDEFGGYNEKGVGAEDYDLPQRIEEVYGQNSVYAIRDFIVHNEGHISLWSTCKKRFYYGQNIGNYRSVKANKVKYEMQSSLLQRYKLFFHSPKKLFAHPLIGGGMLLMKLCEFVGGGMGFVYAQCKIFMKDHVSKN